MTTLDFLILIVLGAFALLGLWRGFVRELLSLVVWVVAGAWLLADIAAPLFRALSTDAIAQQVLGFALVFVLLLVGGALAARLIDKLLVRGAVLRVSNRALGAAFGAARGAVVVVLVFLLAGLTAIPQRAWWREARLVPYFETIARTAADYLPRDVARHIRYG